jgi:hypothetical protein
VGKKRTKLERGMNSAAGGGSKSGGAAAQSALRITRMFRNAAAECSTEVGSMLVFCSFCLRSYGNHRGLFVWGAGFVDGGIFQVCGEQHGQSGEGCL